MMANRNKAGVTVVSREAQIDYASPMIAWRCQCGPFHLNLPANPDVKEKSCL
jgi:hypothetical protein